MGIRNQRAATVGLVQLELVGDLSVSNGVSVTKNALSLLGMYTKDQTGELMLHQHEQGKLKNQNCNGQ